jgi:hypothetical protein
MSTSRFRLALREMSEDELRRQVVIPLVRVTKDVHGVTDVHGTNERGLDVIFFVDTGIERLCYGLQLKKGNIGGGGTKDGTVQEILTQLTLASRFKHPVAIHSPGEHQIDRFVVATTGHISNTAREEIGRAFEKGKVLFWDESTLINRLHNDLPDFFQVSDGAAVTYLRSIEDRLNSLDSLDQIPGVAKRTLSQVFVEPYLRRRFDPAVTAGAHGSHASEGLPALDILNDNTHVVILGDQDGGKTSILRMLAMRRAHALLTGGSKESAAAIPVLLRATTMLGTGLSVTDAVAAEFRALGAPELADGVDAELAQGDLFLAIDGFSELSSVEDKERLSQWLEDFRVAHPKVSVIVAARPVDFLQVKYLASYRQFTIEEFNDAQVGKLLRCWAGDSPTYEDVAVKMADRLREALQLPGSPIPAMIGVMLHEEQNRYITNTAEAIDRYMVIRLGRYAHELGMKQEVDWTRKQDMLAEVAFGMITNEENHLSRDEFVRRFHAFYVHQGEDSKADRVVAELIESGVLVETGDLLQFHRSSLRDFFAAHHVVQRGDLDDFARDHLYEREWGGVITFAAGLRRRNPKLLTNIVAALERQRANALGDPSEDYLYAGYLCGRVLSNSDTTNEDVRVAALKATLDSFDAGTGVIRDLVIKQFGPIGDVLSTMATEYSFFVAVGVPWLRNQFRSLMDSVELSEEERYILAGCYVHLGYDDCYRVLQKVVQDTSSVKVLLLIDILLRQLAGRGTNGPEQVALSDLKLVLTRKLKRNSKLVKELLEVRSPLLEMERRRMERLMAKYRREGKS